MDPSIVVVGSSNTDMVIKADHLPAPGETVIGGSFFMNPGGKGANQAVAAARLGGNITFITKTGDDVFGRQSVRLFEEEKINTAFILSDSGYPSGVALITIDKHAENCIVVASGANAALKPDDIRPALALISKASVVLLQLEIPLATVEFVAAQAAAAGVPVILNPAPVCPLPDHLFRNVNILTPNKKEAEMLSGIVVSDMESVRRAGEIIRLKGIQTVIITLGPHGAVVIDENNFTHVPVNRVEAVDTTAAGDVFNGALAVAIARGYSILDATSFACRAAAISVTRLGAQSSAPYQSEMNAVTRS